MSLKLFFLLSNLHVQTLEEVDAVRRSDAKHPPRRLIPPSLRLALNPPPPSGVWAGPQPHAERQGGGVKGLRPAVRHAVAHVQGALQKGVKTAHMVLGHT